MTLSISSIFLLNRLGEPLEKLRENNGGVFEGYPISRVRKKDATPMAPYEIEAIRNEGVKFTTHLV